MKNANAVTKIYFTKMKDYKKLACDKCEFY